jgi:hypothetical protein
MDTGRALIHATTALLAVAAVLVARSTPTHRPFAAWMVWFVVSDWARIGIAALKADAPRPYRGGMLALAMVDRGLVLLWTFTFLALVLHYFTPLRLWKIAAILIMPFAIALAYALNYPAVRGATYADLIRYVSMFCVALTWVAIVWGTLFRADSKPTVAHLAVMFFACAEVIALAVPYAGDLFTGWNVVRVIMLITMGACLIAHAWALTRRPAPDPS